MSSIFYREIKEDPRLNFEVYAVDNVGLVEKLNLPLTAAWITESQGHYCSLAIYLNEDIADSAMRFHEKYHNKEENGKRTSVGARVYFDNDESFFAMTWVSYFNKQFITKQKCILHATTDYDYLRLTVNGVGGLDIHTNLVPYVESDNVEGFVKDVVDECMRIQEENPPKPLTPMEIMRKNAAKRFAANNRNTAYPPNNSQDAVAVNENDPNSIFNAKSLKITEGAINPKKELEKIVGLESVKREFEKMEASLYMQKERNRQLNISSPIHSGHMCFMGAPGTGKTTMARMVAGILFEMGMIKKNQCVEVAGLDLLANYIGQTSIKTQTIVDAAKGGVLFIDEAYAIAESSFGAEAVAVLLKEMEDNRDGLVVILAGYERDMNRLLNLNQGFRSRINRYFHFENYKVDELAKLFMFNLRSRNLLITKDALAKALTCFAKDVNSPNFSNGRYVRNFTEKIEDRHIINRQFALNDDNLNLITVDDIVFEEE